MTPIGIAVVGCGYWGPNVVRNFASLPDAELRVICDRDVDRMEALRRRFPAARAAPRFEDVLGSPDVDAVAICTPVATHYPLASAALEAGKHVMIEKPVTDSVETARALVELAEARDRVLHVDHTFVYTGAVRKIRSLVKAGDLGELLYIDCVRINLGLFQSDVNVVWDLGAHDTSIVASLVDQRPIWVSAIGSAHLGPMESQAYVVIKFEGSLIAHLHVNWLAPVKIRSTVIGGTKRMIVYNDLEPSEKVRVYDKGVTLNSDAASRSRALVDYRVGDMFAPYIEKTEPLELVCQAFLDAIAHGRPSPTNGRNGLEVVRILEAAEQSMRKEGQRVPLDLVS